MGHYNNLRIKYPGFLLEPPVVDINKLTSVVQGIFPVQVLKFTLGDMIKNHASSSPDTKNENMEEVVYFCLKVRIQISQLIRIQTPSI